MWLNRIYVDISSPGKLGFASIGTMQFKMSANDRIQYDPKAVFACRHIVPSHDHFYAELFENTENIIYLSDMWNCGSSSADALELQQSWAGPSASIRKLLYTYVAMLPWLY